MKRSLGTSDSLGALMSMCPTAEEEYSPGSNHVIYNNREYQSMVDGVDEDGHVPEKKRRLSLEQVKALEMYFEKENKLEPESKVKLAQELGLQPRQVAVWFQNRRARWKTRQLERDYGLLKSSFDDLNNNYESLQNDKVALLKEIKELRSKLKEDNKNTESKLSLSIKEEANLLSECDNNNNNNKSMVAANTTINPEAAAKLNFKERSSDSDSSAILNDDRSPNASNSSYGVLVQDHQILVSPNSFRFNCSSPQFVKMEEHNFFGGEEACNFFSDEQAPTLHWYCPDQWN